MPQVRVHILPAFVPEASLEGSTAVVIDVLRATTTIATALAAGAAAVVPCLEIDDAIRRVGQCPAGTAVLGGERSGVKIEGFALGNSPAEYTTASIGGKTVVFTTTNGTRALGKCQGAKQVLLAALVNLSAVADKLAECEQVDLICAGTDGQPTREDLMVAGAICQQLTADQSWTLDDMALVARDAWREAVLSKAPEWELDSVPPSLVTSVLAQSRGGANLIQLGMADDVALAARIDVLPVVPVFDVATGEIRAK